MKQKNFFMAALLLGSCIAVAQTPNRPVIPLEYMAEYSLGTNIATGAFATTHDADSVGWYTVKEMQEVLPQGYHVPSKAEIFSVIPEAIFGQKGIYFGSRVADVRNRPETVEFGGRARSFLCDYRSRGNVIYAIRFQGYHDEFLSAYRYERVGEFGSAGWCDRKAYLKVQAKYLGPGFSGSLETVSNEEFWKSDNIVTRILPANGKISMRKTSFEGSEMGSMISMMYDAGNNYYANVLILQFEPAVELSILGNTNLLYGMASVRPFRNKLPEQPVYGKAVPRSSFKVIPAAKRPALPIDKMATFNVSKTPKVLAKTNDVETTGFFQMADAMTSAPQGYHVPSLREWMGVFPKYLMRQNDNTYFTTNELILANGLSRQYGAEYIYIQTFDRRYVAYGLKFKGEGNKLLSAYRYEYDPEKKSIIVTCRYLGPEFDGTVHDLNRNDGFWDVEGLIVRELPIAGECLLNQQNRIEKAGDTGNYIITDTPRNQYFFVKKNMMKAIDDVQPSIYGYSVRPWKNR